MDTIDKVHEVLEPLLEDRACRTLDGRVERLHHRYNSLWKPFEGELTADQKFEAFDEMEMMMSESENFARLARAAGRYDLVANLRSFQQTIRASSVYQEVEEDGAEMVRQHYETFQAHETYSERVAECDAVINVPDDRDYTFVRGRKVFAVGAGAGRATMEARTAALTELLGRRSEAAVPQYA